ncbi:hypothetical protein BOSP111201_24030 [Bordetella sputigena]|uniref:trypsin-like serine protease n=1 Tax=Bordetella sputigena TaxID=1416810 RepID=UPI0039EE99A7
MTSASLQPSPANHQPVWPAATPDDRPPLWDRFSFWANEWWAAAPPKGYRGFRPEQSSYVKLQSPTGVNYARCHGSLIGDDVVLTAAHCIKPERRTVNIYYGRDFGFSRRIVLGEEGTNWVKAKAVPGRGAAADWGLLKLSRPVGADEGAITARLPQHGDCPRDGDTAQAYRGMGLPPSDMGIQHTKTVNVRVDDGRHLHLSSESVADKGDSGSPLMSTNEVQIGVQSAGSDKHDLAVALCRYSDLIRAAATRLTPV